jgi:predicted lysophospholipase L1 biosynthesis ABC-type transport system permease subunit
MLLMRSSELAAYRFSGTRQSDLFRILLAEQVLIGGVAVLFCSFGLTVASWVVPGIPWTVLLSSWVVGTTWVASFSLIAGALTLRNPATLARER